MYKNMGYRVMVHYNLHKHTFSITHKGLVISHADYVKLWKFWFAR